MPSFSFATNEQLSNSNNAKQSFVFPDSPNKSSSMHTSTDDTKRLPMKDVSNKKLTDTPLADTKAKACSSETSTKERLLNQVKLQWITGERKRQTPSCKALIRECIEIGIPRNEIASHIVSGMSDGVKVIEFLRVKRICKAMSREVRHGQGKVRQNGIDGDALADWFDAIDSRLMAGW